MASCLFERGLHIGEGLGAHVRDTVALLCTGKGSVVKLVVPRPVSAAYIEAAKVGAKKIALTVLDSFKVRDGRAIGDLIFGELEGLRLGNAMEASIIRQIQRHAANVPGNAKVRDVIKADELERIIQRGAEVADAA